MKKDNDKDSNKKFEYNKDIIDLLKSLDNAIREINEARELFNIADNPNLIDYAIYKESAAEAKYMYLLNQAKNKNIKIKSNLFKQDDKVV